MEIRVEAVGGASLPPDCHVAVRFAECQKQGVYDPSRLYRFPEAKRFGRIDVFQRVGTCDLMWDAEAPEARTCNVAGVGGANVTLQVNFSRPAAGMADGGGPTPKGDDRIPVSAANLQPPPSAKSAKRKDMSAEAKKYLQEHNVENMLTGAMRALLKTMPEDAPSFLSDYITGNFKKKVAAKPPPSKARPVLAMPFKDYYKESILPSVCRMPAMTKLCASMAPTPDRRPEREHSTDAPGIPCLHAPSVGTWSAPRLPALSKRRGAPFGAQTSAGDVQRCNGTPPGARHPAIPSVGAWTNELPPPLLPRRAARPPGA